MNGNKESQAKQSLSIPVGNSILNKLKTNQGVTINKKRRLDPEEPVFGVVPMQTSQAQQLQQHSAQPPPTQKQKKYKKEVYAKISQYTFADVGGMDKTLKELCELILHIKHPEIYRHIGLPSPRGFLLHGPPGSGKNLVAHAIAGQLDVSLIEIPATELIAGISGESEGRIREVFEQAAALAPCVLFLDEIDAVSSNRTNAQKDMERRIVAQLLSSLDNLSKLQYGDQVLVIGATNRPEALDPALRRVGRFDHEISLGIPDREARSDILQVISKNLKLETPFDFDELAALTPGYVGADLLALATKAASNAIKRVLSKKENEQLVKDFEERNKKKFDVDPIVNLDEDSLLMDVDDSEVKPAEENKKEDESDQVEIIDTDTETPATVPQSSENAASGEDDTEKQTSETGPMETEKTEEAVSSSDLPVAQPDNEKMESEDTTPTESPEKETNSEEMKTDEPPKESSDQEKKKDSDERKSENPSEETLTDAVLKEPGLKLQLTLDNMIKWLQNDTTPLSDEELNSLCIMRDDFMQALKFVQPSAKREGFITVPGVTWNDIGSLQDIREELKLAILAPVKYPERLKSLGLQSPSGVLLCGPPGCGKTLLAKAVANEAGINFISVKGPELLNMYVGESERAVRQCFQRARNSAPCVIFFDEFDSLCPKRSDSGDGSGASMRVVNQLLTEMDGIEERKGVFLMAATNRPDIVDPAVLRPGRLDKILYVGLPQEKDRMEILLALTKNKTKPPLADDVDLQEISTFTQGYTGADLAGLVRQASLYALKDSIVSDSSQNCSETILVHKQHFVNAFTKLKPSVSEQVKFVKLKFKIPLNLTLISFPSQTGHQTLRKIERKIRTHQTGKFLKINELIFINQ